ncbi:MAG: VCBS repeat-containing protein [Planctomycetota bacterium]|nr:VCBS repeat-containing protein [Planctomycetota bacterium]
MLLVVIAGCEPQTPVSDKDPSKVSNEPTKSQKLSDTELKRQIDAFCGACHGVPLPESFPKSAWHEEVNKGFNFYLESGRSDLVSPPMVEVVEWYVARAPRELVIARQDDLETSPKVPFRFEPALTAVELTKANTAVASLAWRPLTIGGKPELLFCDMRFGGVKAFQPTDPKSSLRVISFLENPCHAETCDLDGDGILDLLVADLGSFLPQDHAKGAVVWLRGKADGAYEQIVLQDQVGRVADIEPADFDNDGDLDLVVAEFGWRKTGRILLLENLGAKEGRLEFSRHVIDGRHGSIHVPAVDLDGDGQLDFIAVVSQEHETIDAFLNQGGLKFARQTIFRGPDPTYGSTGIQVIDFDADGDLDCLATNGDMFDTFYLKPYHGVRWFENRGEFPWTEHFLAEMPGVHRALAGDLDGDGDLDIAACSLFPDSIAGNQIRPDFDAVLWLEQTEPGQFRRHSLRKGHGRFPSLELADFDADGDLDIAVGAIREDEQTPTVGVFWNDRIP